MQTIASSKSLINTTQTPPSSSSTTTTQTTTTTAKLDDEELNSKIACSNYELAPLLLCQNSTNELYYSSQALNNSKSAITTLTSTNCSSKSKTKGSGFKLNKNLFQNLNSIDYFNKSLWKNIVNKKNFSSESMMKSLADDTAHQQKTRFDRKHRKSSHQYSRASSEDKDVDLYVTNCTSTSDTKTTKFKTARRGSGKFRIKPNMSLKSEIAKLQKQQTKLNLNGSSINDVISITSQNPANGTLINPDTLYTKLLASKSSLNLKLDINAQRKREKTNVFKESLDIAPVNDKDSTITSTTATNSKLINKPPLQHSQSSTKLPILFNKTNLLMPQKYLESLEVKKISPVNKYNIYDFAELFDSNSQLFVDIENRVYLPELQSSSLIQNRQTKSNENFDLNLKFEQMCINDYTNHSNSTFNNKLTRQPPTLNDSIQSHLESIKQGLNLNSKREYFKREDKKEAAPLPTSKVSNVDNKLYLEIYMPCMS